LREVTPDLLAPDGAHSVLGPPAQGVSFIITSPEITTTGNQMVVFKQEQIPSDFAAQVEALGGKVELVVASLGVATVLGLDATALEAPASYTNYGRSAINVAAPGGNNGGYVMAACSPFSLVVTVCQTGTYVVSIAGTSMATPHVSGLAAMVIAEYGNNPAQVRNRIEKFADDLGQPGTDPYYGKGRINVYRTMTGQ
jgi:subtilisin family serine protease